MRLGSRPVAVAAAAAVVVAAAAAAGYRLRLPTERLPTGCGWRKERGTGTGWRKAQGARSKEREARLVWCLVLRLGLLLVKRAGISYFRSARPRSQIATIYAMQSLFTPPRSVASVPASRERLPLSRRSLQRHPPCVFRSPALFSFQRLLTAHRKPGLCITYVWCVCRPFALFSAIAHSISSVVDCRSPSSPILLLQEVPFSCVQRTGCSACLRLRPPTSGLVGAPPMYIARAWSR
jgi:hypothetical protein